MGPLPSTIVGGQNEAAILRALSSAATFSRRNAPRPFERSPSGIVLRTKSALPDIRRVNPAVC